MSTNLLIGYAEIPHAATATTFSGTPATNQPIANLFGNHRAAIFGAATAASGDQRLTFDLGSGVTKSANYFFISRARLLQKDGVVTLDLKAHTSNTYGSATSVKQVASFDTLTLVGPQGEDYVTTFAASSAFRWWFMNYNSTAVSKVNHSKLFFGTSFDPGRDPDDASWSIMRTRGSQRRMISTVQLTWSALSYNTTIAMHNLLSVPRRYNSFVLFTTSYHHILNDWKTFYCRVLDFTAPPVVTDRNEVSATFEELL